MGAGAERAARVDDDEERVRRRLLPRRADPEATDPDRLVIHPPALFPPALDVRALGRAEEVPDLFLAGGVGVGDELDASGMLDLLEPLREELDHGCPRLLGASLQDLDRDPPQATHRNALFSFSKKPSSAR